MSGATTHTRPIAVAGASRRASAASVLHASTQVRRLVAMAPDKREAHAEARAERSASQRAERRTKRHAKRLERMAKIGTPLTRSWSFSRERLGFAGGNTSSNASETQSESTNASEPRTQHIRYPSASDTGMDFDGQRQITQWASGVASSSGAASPLDGVAPPMIPPAPEPGTPTHGRRRRHHRITRPVPASAPGVLTQLSERMLPARVPSLLWQMTSDRLLPAWASSESSVWLLGTYYGPPEPEGTSGKGASSESTSGNDTESAACSDDGSDKSDTRAARRRWRTQLDAHVRTLVACTYRARFPPIALDGYIGADEEATAAAVSAATEELCTTPDTPHDAQRTAEGTQPCAAPSLTHLLLHPGEVLHSSAATRDWLVQQLESRGWQLPGLLAQLPNATGLLSRQEPSTPAAVAPSLRAILDAVEHDVLFALRHPIAASLPIARLRDALMSHLSNQPGLPGLWSYVGALYDTVSSIARPAGLTSDTGWGCMLRTAQSMLANALLRVHLGAAWRMPPARDGQTQWRSAEEHATYTRILSLFLDDPSSACPFGIHRLAAEGKRLGVEVGAWFGPSTAAAVLQRLANPTHLGLGIAATNDGMVYTDEVRDASHAWARPVLVLIAQRLGLDEIPKPYRAALKQTFAFPQSMGIAGGRPSSSLYFIGSQRDQLLYLDPHTTRPSVPFRHTPPSLQGTDVLDTSDAGETRALLTSWYCHAYAASELATYHVSQAQLMPLSAVDPSVLFGFVVRSADELEDLRARVDRLGAPLFGVAARRADVPDNGADPEAASLSASDSEWVA